MTVASMRIVLKHVADERMRQDRKFPEQHLPDGTGASFKELADWFRDRCDHAASEGTLTWRHVLLEETFEALAEEDPAALRVELIQTAAVVARWIEDIDSR